MWCTRASVWRKPACGSVELEEDFEDCCQDERPSQPLQVDGGRDVRGKEREKTGTGKKLERNAFFPFPILHFLTTFFFPFLVKIVKNG